MKPAWIAVAFLFGCGGPAAEAATSTYFPLQSWDNVSPSIETNIDQLSGRPYLPGVRPVGAELLIDATLRKQPSLEGDGGKAVRSILKRTRSPGGLGPLRGVMAEALYIHRNEGWRYVANPSATQHDAYFPIEGKPPYTAQVKYHDTFNGAQYARDMIADYRSPRFAVPDDHVDDLRTFLDRVIRREQSSGNVEKAAYWAGQRARVVGLGASTVEVRAATLQAVRTLSREHYSSYAPLGVSVAFVFIPLVTDLSAPGLTPRERATTLFRSSSIALSGPAADFALKRLGLYAWRGTFRGNAVIAGAIILTETAWSVYELGPQKAFGDPKLNAHRFVSASSVGLGLLAGGVVAQWSSEMGPWAFALTTGAGIVTTILVQIAGDGTVEYFSEWLDPKGHARFESEMVARAREIVQYDADAQPPHAQPAASH